MWYMVKNHRSSSAFATTVKKAEKKFLPRDKVTTKTYEDVCKRCVASPPECVCVARGA